MITDRFGNRIIQEMITCPVCKKEMPQPSTDIKEITCGKCGHRWSPWRVPGDQILMPLPHCEAPGTRSLLAILANNPDAEVRLNGKPVQSVTLSYDQNGHAMIDLSEGHDPLADRWVQQSSRPEG